MKKIISLLLIFMMAAAGANAQPLYSKTTEEIVTGGVNLKNIQRFYGDYALNINCITADLKNENLSLELLKNSGGVDKVDTVFNLAQAEENVVAATNADFFSAYKGDQNFSLGIEIKDGELLQSHINADMAAGFLKENVLSLSYLTFSGEVTAPNGTVMPLAHINKPTDYYGALLMYTADFNGGVSPFLPEGITAVTVQGGTVSAKGISLGGTIPVPEDGYILVINDSMTPFLEYNFNVGDEVELSVSVTPSTEGVDTAFGGGTLLLSGGAKTAITHNVSGNNPRTAIGTNADGTVIYMITVDGRQTDSRGVTLDTLADICLELGCVNAMNFDGGSSTAMVGKTLSENELHFINSPSENRKVINAVAITSSAEPGEAVGFLAEPENENVLSGDSVKLKLTAYDENYNTPERITGSPEWVVSQGGGYVRDNVYYPQGSGKAVLDLYYNGEKTDSCEINVISEVSGIVTDRELTISSGGSIPTKGLAKVFDKYGNTAPVNDISLLNPEFDKGFIYVSAESIKALREGGGQLTLSHSRARRNIGIICGNYDVDIDESVTADELYSEEGGGFSFNVLGFQPVTTLFDRIVYARGMDIFRNADACSVLGSSPVSDLTPDALSPLSADKWNEVNHENAKIISLELSSSGIMQRGEQWKKLAAALSGASQKNVFVLLNSAADFAAEIDRAAFSKQLSDSAKDKNVFVIYNGDENFCKIDGGVRCISLADSKDESVIWKSIANTKYLSFNITTDKATYCFKKLYN